MRQRGRKSISSLSVVGRPHLVASQPPDNPPPCPNHLGGPERAIWDAITGDWKGSPASFFVLVSTLEAHQRAREARETIDQDGMTVVGRDGQPRAHPLCTVERDARAAFQRGLKQLGIKV